jgi:hypothetical protein
VLLFSACGIVFALTATAQGMEDAADTLREKDVLRAEAVIAKLKLLDEALPAASDPRTLRTLTGKLYPGLFITVADMRESDLKTDLDTAVFLYEQASLTWFAAGVPAAECGRERRDIYQPLCRELRGGSTRELLLAKARLHARWAEACVDYYRGRRAAETSRSLSAMKAARENDFIIAGKAVEALETLKGLVDTIPENDDYRERRAVAGFAPSDTIAGDALSGAGELIALLPRSPAFYHLSNAWSCYKDGLFWERKVSRSRSLVVSARGFASDPLKDIGVNADSAAQTVVASFKNATKYTRLAEQSLGSAGHSINRTLP